MNNRILVIPVKLRRREVLMQDGVQMASDSSPTWRLLRLVFTSDGVGVGVVVGVIRELMT